LDPLDLRLPLQDVLDVDALQALFVAPGATGRVEFTYRDHVVAVDADGRVSLRN
jgi:hypothetical protein